MSDLRQDVATEIEIAEQRARSYRHRFHVATGLFGIAALAFLVWLAFSSLGLRVTADQPDTASAAPNFPKGGPAEFLYLDSRRVAAFLAQIDGGGYSSIKESSKLTTALDGKLSLNGIGELGGSKSQEEAIERVVTPTAASSFFALYSALKKQHEVRRINLPHFHALVAGLPEGQFVSFKTRALLPPIYLNAYLASRRPLALDAIFPGGDSESVTRHAGRERRASRRFRRLLGKDPRAVFALQARRRGQKVPFDYLLPLNAERLTEEASLLKYGGGKFTVVGKVIRIFPEDGDTHEPPYIDSAARGTWKGPLRKAPGELLCRTYSECAQEVRADELRGAARKRALRGSRRQLIGSLNAQTVVEKNGAVILPIAIYK